MSAGREALFWHGVEQGADGASAAKLRVSLCTAQARGLLRRSEVVERLLVGIADSIEASVEGNARDPSTQCALQSDAYWNHFEMHLKEALLVAFSWVDPPLCEAVRETLDITLRHLKKTYRFS